MKPVVTSGDVGIVTVLKQMNSKELIKPEMCELKYSNDKNPHKLMVTFVAMGTSGFQLFEYWKLFG